MAGKTLSEKKAECILDAARQVFLEHGFSATSMDQVATEAQVSKATIYAHHKNKKALFAAIVSRECQRTMADRAITHAADEGCSLQRGLTQMGQAYMNTLLSSHVLGLSRAVYAEVVRFPELGQIYYDSAPNQVLGNVVGYLERAHRKGFLVDCDTRRAADQFLGMLRGDIYVRAQFGRAPTAAEVNATIEEAVITFCARYASQSVSA